MSTVLQYSKMCSNIPHGAIDWSVQSVYSVTILCDVFWYPTWGNRLVSTNCLQCHNIVWYVLLSHVGSRLVSTKCLQCHNIMWCVLLFTLGRFSTFSAKGNDLCDFLFAWLCTKLLLKIINRCLVYIHELKNKMDFDFKCVAAEAS